MRDVLAKLSGRYALAVPDDRPQLVQLVRDGRPGPVRCIPSGRAATAVRDGDTIVVLHGDGVFSSHVVGAAEQRVAVCLGA